MLKKRLVPMILLAFLFMTQFLYAEERISLQEITVTAQKQEENYKDIPISLTIFNQFDIEDRGFEDFTDLAGQSSNFTIFDAGGTGMMSPFIRGIASDTGVESSNVGVYIDGIPYVNTFGNDIFMEDVERIEILKGPQSILYGKNSYSGVVNVISRAPGNDFEGNAKIQAGSDGVRKYHLFLNTPIIKDRLMVNGSFHHYEKDGFIKNIFLNNEDNFQENNFGKLNFLFVPTENLELSLVSSFLDQNNGAPNWNTNGAANPRQVASNLEGLNDTENITNSFKIDYEFQKIKFSSITTVKHLDNHTVYDADFSPANGYHVDADMELREYSQEIRCSGKNSYFDYLIGAYTDSMTKERLLKMNNNVFQKYKTNSKTISFFANMTVPVLPQMDLSLGTRIDRDRITLNDYLLGIEDTNSDTTLSPKITLTYDVLPGTMTYATISRGYKSGGYYMFAPSLNQRWVDNEKMTNYEVGFKSYLSRKFSLGGSVFLMKLKDKQVTTHIDSVMSYVDNAARSETKGFELDADYLITKHWHLYASLGYSDSSFAKFKDSQGNYSGKQNPFSPKYNYSVGAKYRGDTGLFALINLRGQDKFYTDKQNTLATAKFHILDAKLGYEQDHYEIYIYANNLMDKEHDIIYGVARFLSPPREMGVQFRYRF